MFKKSLVLALPLAVLTAFSVAPSAGAAPLTRSSLHAASAEFFSDAAGDSGVAADITDVDVGNDVVDGPIVFWVTLANRPDDLIAGDDLSIYLDTDRNPATGDAGAEYAISVDAEVVGLYRWDVATSTYVFVESSSASARFSKGDKAMRVSVHPNDLGGITAFTFSVQSRSGEAIDAAPNGPPDWPYTLAAGPVSLVVNAAALVPKTPVAGKKLAAALLITRRDINEVLSSGKVTCTLKVGTKSVRTARSGFSSGLPFCSWNVPRSAKGKLLRGSISVTFGGVTVKRTFSKRAR